MLWWLFCTLNAAHYDVSYIYTNTTFQYLKLIRFSSVRKYAMLLIHDILLRQCLLLQFQSSVVDRPSGCSQCCKRHATTGWHRQSGYEHTVTSSSSVRKWCQLDTPYLTVTTYSVHDVYGTAAGSIDAAQDNDTGYCTVLITTRTRWSGQYRPRYTPWTPCEIVLQY